MGGRLVVEALEQLDRTPVFDQLILAVAGIDEQDLARAVAKRFNGKQAANTSPAVQSGEPLSSNTTT
jgi:hypothetical protein